LFAILPVSLSRSELLSKVLSDNTNNSDDDAYDNNKDRHYGNKSQPVDQISIFSNHKYINLETYKKDGKAVVTPVWFTIDSGKIFVVTKSETGKVKRLRNNQAVRVMPSGMRGQPKGEWLNGKGKFATPEELERALKQRNKKYGLQARLAGLFSASRGELVAFSITLQ